MKKVLVAFLMIALLVSLCACSVPAGSFMGRAQVNSLVKKYGTPQAELTIKYEAGADKVVVKVTYDLLLDKAPLAVTRFIQIANEGGYEDTFIDQLETTYKTYMVMGRYAKDEVDSKKYYDLRSADVAFAGEFESNKYRQPKGGYAEFKMFSLAMYHENVGEKFDSANGTLILSLSSQTRLNSADYAVFAEFQSMTVYVNEKQTYSYTKVDPSVLANLQSFTTATSHDVYKKDNPNTTTSNVKIISAEPTLSVKILGDSDWSKLPTIR